MIDNLGVPNRLSITMHCYRPIVFASALCHLVFNGSVLASEESDWLQSLSATSLEHGAGGDKKAVASRVSGAANIDAYALETAGAGKLRAHADAALRTGDFAVAIGLLEKALELEPADGHARSLYAQALQLRLQRTKSQDPALFNQCVKQWFHVFKNSEYLEDSKIAEENLVLLTGKRPRLLSTANGYLRAVLKSETSEAVAPVIDEPAQVP